MTNKTIALVGNPNCGKTTLFNQLTGTHQKVGNWPGVTIEKKSGTLKLNDQLIDIVDLPGTYSLTHPKNASTKDMQIACDYIINSKPDLIINILDASNLERHLYLTTQLIEMGKPILLVVNMMDIAERKGIHIDLAELYKLTGCPTVALVAKKKKGLSLFKKLLNSALLNPNTPTDLNYSQQIQACIDELSHTLNPKVDIHTNWLAIKLLENDDLSFLYENVNTDSYNLAQKLQARLSEALDEDTDILIADARYQRVSDIINKCLKKNSLNKKAFTEKLDQITLNKWFGFPIFLLVMYALFTFSITIGTALQPLFDDGSRVIFIEGVAHLCKSIGLPTWLTVFFSQGIGLGINTVLTFTPQIACLFLFLSFLEDSGYMARAAFVVDKLMQKMGLPGKSFVPLIVGFGCNVPAIMSTRTLESRRDRLLTIMMSPFMSCGARLAIFSVFATAFFSHSNGSLIIFALYCIGIFVAVLTGLMMKHTLLKHNNTPFVMELPQYHLPNIKSIIITTWQRLKGFIIRAGRVIIPMCFIIGTLNTIQFDGSFHPDGSEHSILSVASKQITPIFHPIGVTQDNWPATVGLVTGTLAKEVVIGTLNTLYHQNNQANNNEDEIFSLSTGLQEAIDNTIDNFKNIARGLKNPFTANEADGTLSSASMGSMQKAFGSVSAAFAYLIFVLLYVPCLSTVGAMVKEAGRRWAYLSVAWSTCIAYALSLIFYQSANFLSHPGTSLFWIAIAFTMISLFIISLKILAKQSLHAPYPEARHE